MGNEERVDTGSRMKELRLQLGLSVDEIIGKLGISRSTYFRYENGDIEKMPVHLLKPIADVLRTTPDYLAGWTDEQSDTTSKLLAAHIEDDVTNEEMEEIMQFIDFIKNKRK